MGRVDVYVDCLWIVFLALGFVLGFVVGGVTTNEMWKDKLKKDKEDARERPE